MEIINDLKGLPLGGFVSGIGSGGTIMGIGKRLKEQYPDLVITAVEPEKMALLTGKEVIGNHKIEGIGDDFIPELVDTKQIDFVCDICDEDATNMAKIISKALGIGVGISSGANLLGSVILQEKIDKAVVTIFPDDNKKYLSTDLTKNIKLNENSISSDVDLLGYETL